GDSDRRRLYPALDGTGSLAGVVTRRDLETWLAHEAREMDSSRTLQTVVRPVSTVAFSDEPLRVVIHRMAHTGVTALPVVDHAARGRLLGLVSLDDMLKARVRHLEEERRRERVLPLRLLVPFAFAGGRRRESATPAPVESAPSSEIETGA